MHRDIHIYTLTLVYTHIYSPPHTDIQYSYTYNSIYTQICTFTICMHAHSLTHIHTLIQTHTVTYTHMHIHTYPYIYTYVCSHTDIHIHSSMHEHIHSSTHIHILTLIQHTYIVTRASQIQP